MTGRMELPDADPPRAIAQRMGARVAATLFDLLGRPEARKGAIEDLQRMIVVEPASWSAWVNLHWLLSSTPEVPPEEAAALLLRMEALDSKNVYLCVYTARRLSDRGEYARALKVLQRAENSIPPDGILQHEFTLELLRAVAGTGDTDGLIAAFQKRFDDVGDEIERFHLSFHVDATAAAVPQSVLAKLDTAKIEAALGKFIEENKDGLSYTTLLISAYARAGRKEDEFAALLDAAKRFLGIERIRSAFQHFFYRYGWRILVTQEMTGVP